MSNEREYAVIINPGDDITIIEEELTKSTGSGPIPSRSVEIANPRPGSRRMTHFMLTDNEAKELENDPRIFAVEIPPDQRDDLLMKLSGTQTGSFYRGNNFDNNNINWGLRRVIEENNNLYGATRDSPGTPFEYTVDGTGVDVVIQDTGTSKDHPEWLDSNGVSRFVELDWYAASGLVGALDPYFYDDYHGHGTHCAGIAAGKTYGWAKNARIYAQKVAGLEGPADPGVGISIANAFDAIRLWHISKNGSRPTVVNMSWGVFRPFTVDPTLGTYRGVSWVWGTDYNDDNDLFSNTGVMTPRFGTRELREYSAVVDAEIDDMIDAGIHVCIAAGNDQLKSDIIGGVDYDNSVTINGITNFYHRPNSPYSPRAFNVGNIDSTTEGILDKTRSSSKRGPGVNIWAPGGDITSACSDTTIFSSQLYPSDEAFKIATIGGTSMASPQVAGVIAQHLQVRPDLTPEQMLQRIINDSKSVIYDTGLDNDYSDPASIQGSPNRMLFNRYNKQPYYIRGNITYRN